MKTALYISLIFIACNTFAQAPVKLVNTSHLDFLYEDKEIAGRQMGIAHIYSDYPDYEWVDDGDEGTACVDDAARAAVFYLRYGKANNDVESIRKARALLEFVMYMQSENGYLYNFIWPDGSINKEYQTSVNKADWWTWRGLWALMEGYEYFKEADVSYSNILLEKAALTIDSIKKDIPAVYNTQVIGGFTRPTWLPSGTASDQAAVLLTALLKYYKAANDSVVFEYCKKLGDGICLMQEGGQGSFPYGVFLSSENTWHGWGNSQSYSLLNLFEAASDSVYLRAALKEVNYFYDYIISKNYLSGFSIGKAGSTIFSSGEDKYPQIAYIIRPMVFASLKAYEITQDTAYALKAAKLASWFYGKNPAGVRMYNPDNGICYDGINGAAAVNKNSGAESTIEALLTLQAIESSPYAAQQFNSIIEIATDGGMNTPENFALSNNYPNPFNPSTTIEYQVSRPSHISISIYNMLGENIRTLINAYHNAGSYQTLWDGKNESGTDASSGIYFYKMTSENRSITK
ncbi:MAG TPA: T9SS type A sorting domain-containing protein, partial [Ignavibacteriales bacterium]|nr:T9SS type A sorting domain-containing protein [Ignavibacteriales bacterium]